MFKKHGEITVRAGKEVVKLKKIIDGIVKNSKDPNKSHDDKIGFIKKRNNLLLISAQKSKNKYISSVNNLSDVEINKEVHDKNLHNFNVVIRMAEEIKDLNSNNPLEYTNIINRYKNRL